MSIQITKVPTKGSLEGVEGDIKIGGGEITLLSTKWNGHVEEVLAGTATEKMISMQDFILTEYAHSHYSELPDYDTAGGVQVDAVSHLTDTTFKRRVYASMRGTKDFTAHFKIMSSGRNEWVSYYTMYITK